MNDRAALKKIITSPVLLLVCRLSTGVVFIVSGAARLPLQAEFVEIVKSYHMLPDALAIAYGTALPWVEFLAGCYLVAGILVIPSAAVVLLMGISFLAANISAAVTGESFCSNCFGSFFSLSVSQAIAVDILLVTAAGILLLSSRSKHILSFDTWFARRFGKAGNG